MPIDPVPSSSGSTPPGTSFSAKPFVIEFHQADRHISGRFRPVSFLILNESFRTGGLLSALPAEELKSLMYLLTFVSPNGDCGAAIHQLCSAMRLSALKVRRRMGRLVSFHWAGAQLVLEHKRESGLTVYAPHPALVEHRHITPPESTPEVTKVASRHAVIAHSRETYTKPRAEVEAQILADMMRFRSPEAIARLRPKFLDRESDGELTGANVVDGQPPGLLDRLQQVGLSEEQSLHLTRSYDRVRIERQLQWLPMRQANNPAGLLLAAVADDYEAPISLRRSPTVNPRSESDSGLLPGAFSRENEGSSKDNVSL